MVSTLEISEFSSRDTAIDGLSVIAPKFVTDDRGGVRELFRESQYGEVTLGAAGGWRQVNLTSTRRGAVRGLHGEQMNKLVTVMSGSAHGGYVEVSLTPGVQVFVPSGVLNGFQATGDGTTECLYFFDDEWRPEMEGMATTPLDEKLNISWPLAIDIHSREQISQKDADAPTFEQLQLVEIEKAADRYRDVMPTPARLTDRD